MQNFYHYKKFGILYLDDEEKSRKHFAAPLRDQFRIFTAPSAQEGFKVLEAHQDEIGLLMTDQRMPGEKGVWLLEKARQLRPRIIRILATAFSDMDAAVAAVNSGEIYKYVNKPWAPPQLEATLKRGLELFIVQRELDELRDQERAGAAGRVGRAIAHSAPLRSGRADFPHPAPRIMDSLRMDYTQWWTMCGRGSGKRSISHSKSFHGIVARWDRRLNQ